MWPLEHIIAMNTPDGPDPRTGRQGNDPLRGFLRRKALAEGYAPKGMYHYECFDGTLLEIDRAHAASFMNGLLPVKYSTFDLDSGTIKIDVGGANTLYWRDDEF